MTKKMLTILSVVMIAATACAQPDTLWTRTFGGIGSDYGECVQQTDDGGYIIAGYTSSGYGSYNVYLIKTDASGIEQWSQTFGGSYYNDSGHSVRQTSDGGYIITGYTDSYAVDSSDVWLIKTDASGIEQWSQIFGGSDDDFGYSVQQTGDGGYIIAGQTLAGAYFDVYLIKTDASGIEHWSQTFGGSNDDCGHSVQQTDDGGYIMVGWTESYGAGGSDVYLIKTNASGNEQWSQTYGGSADDRGSSVQQTGDGGYIIVGDTYSYGAGNSDAWLIKTDASGIEQWSQTYGGSEYDHGASVEQTSYGEYIISGSTSSYGAGNYDVWLIKTDASGIEQWSQTFGGSGDDASQSVQQTSNGGYVLSGYTTSYGAGGYDVWLICLTVDVVVVTLTPLNLPIQIPAGGGSFNFDIEILNPTANTYTIDVSTDVTLPGATTYPIMTRYDIDLAAGASLTRSLTQFVPGGTPSGNYTYNGYVYDHNTWELLAEDSFPFEKLAGDDSPNHNLGWALYGWDDEEAAFDNLPAEYALHPASPNPFNPTTVLSFNLPIADLVSLTIYDISGRQVAELVNGWRDAGVHEMTFDASRLSSGVYLARLEAGDFTTIQKMVLMK